jgi:hypothetical protein
MRCKPGWLAILWLLKSLKSKKSKSALLKSPPPHHECCEEHLAIGRVFATPEAGAIRSILDRPISFMLAQAAL